MRILILLLLITTSIFGQSPLAGLVSNSNTSNPVTIPFGIISYNISEITDTTARVQVYMTEQCSINYRVDGVLNAASSGDFDAGYIGLNEYRHTRILTGLTPDHTGDLVIEIIAQDDSEVVQSGIISLTTLPSSTTGLAVLSNFRVENATPTLVHFDASTSVSGLLVTGFEIEGKTINSISIDGDNLGGYLTLSLALTFWDNILVRLEGGAETKVYDFTLKYVDNLINEPDAPTIRWAAPTTQGTGSGLTEANAWSYADAGQNATAGMTVNMLAGSTSTAMTIANNGDVNSGPIKFIGYNNAAKNVNRARSLGMAMDATIMPLFTNIAVDYSITNGKDFIILRNIQIFNPSLGGINHDGAVKQIFDNLYIDNNASAEHCMWSNLESTRGNKRLINSYLANATHHGIKWAGVSNLSKNTWIVSSKLSSMDYYFLFDGGLPGYGHSNAVIGCYINRFSGDSHSGHGISFKGDQSLIGWVLEHSLIEDCDIINSKIELRHRPVKYNVARNVRTTDNIGVGLNDGCSYNIIEDCRFTDCTAVVNFYETIENGDVNENAHHNVFKNCVVDGAYTLFGSGTYQTTVPMQDFVQYNEFLNCTFKDVTNFWTPLAAEDHVEIDNTNKITNCVFDTCTNLGTGIQNITFTNTLLWNGFTETGTGMITTVNPLLDANFKPLATFTSIDVSPLSGVEYDKNGLERNTTLTTVGAVLHGDETP